MNHKTEDDMSIGNEHAYQAPMIQNGDGGYTEVRCTGMTYRKWLIGEIVSNLSMPVTDSDSVYRTAARACIRLADAVIAELEAEENK